SLGFHSLVEEMQLGKAQETQTEAQDDYRLILTEAELEKVIATMRAAGCFAVDTETTGTDPMRAELVGVSLCCKAHEAWYLPLAHTAESLTRFEDPDDLTTAVQLEQLPKARALELLRPLLEDPAVGKIGHNIKYDLVIFAREGLNLRGIA